MVNTFINKFIKNSKKLSPVLITVVVLFGALLLALFLGNFNSSSSTSVTHGASTSDTHGASTSDTHGASTSVTHGASSLNQAGGAQDLDSMDLDLDRDTIRPPPYVCGNVILSDLERQIKAHQEQIKHFQEQCRERDENGKGLFHNPLTVYKDPPLDPTVDADQQPITKGLIWDLVKVRFPPYKNWYRVKNEDHAVTLIKSLPPEISMLYRRTAGLTPTTPLPVKPTATAIDKTSHAYTTFREYKKTGLAPPL